MKSTKEDLKFCGSLHQIMYDLGELAELGVLKITNGTFFSDKILIEKLESNDKGIFVNRQEVDYKNINFEIKHRRGIEFDIYINDIKLLIIWNENSKEVLNKFYFKWLLFRKNNPDLYI